ncbi:MAG TPA: MMPL family transporter [Thermoplasmata archaeon]|nr:MMPL family transporter [Thermoplasmata archaeon]
MAEPEIHTRGERIFASLGRGIVRHPWYPILFWIVLLVVALPFLSSIASSTTNSTTSLPAGVPSSIAAAKIAQEFPNSTDGTASYLLFEGPNLTGAPVQGLVEKVSSAIAADRSLRDFAGVASVYSAYSGYLVGEGRLAEGVLAPALSATPSLPAELNSSTQLLWGPSLLFLQNWSSLVAAHPGTASSQWNYPAYNATRAALGGNATLLSVLSAFYTGPSNSGFNGTAACASASNVTACADQVARADEAPLLSTLLPTAAGRSLALAVLQGEGVENSTAPSAHRWAGSLDLQAASGLSARWLDLLWSQFPAGTTGIGALTTWVGSLVQNGTLASYPLPVPTGIASTFLSADGRAEVVIVEFSVASSFVAANGSTPVYDDVASIASLVPGVLSADPVSHSLTYYQTGPAALDTQENSDLNSTIALVLPLTIITLIGITILYFRAPLTPIVTFGGLAIALVLGLACVVLVGHLIEKVDSTTLALVTTFVLGVGTDYSIFLLARYREEVYRGADPLDAIVTTVTWAGQSVATSGATAVIATLALAFSGIALLSQWGMVLSLAVLLTVLISLTLVPAILTLTRKRIFWPYTGARLTAQAAKVGERIRAERTYYFRAGRLTQRRPLAIVGLILLVSVPLIILALTLPISYNFYDQLPGNQSSTEGLSAYNAHFGSGTMFPFQALVTFSSPLLVGNTTNVVEFTDLADLTSDWSNSSGVAAVDSPVGPWGAPLSSWATYAALPPGTQAELRGVLSSYAGTDGSSVLLTIVPTQAGLSYAAVSTFTNLQSGVPALEQEHPNITAVYFGGGAPVTHDLAAQTSAATLRMILLVSIGLLIVLFVVLRTAAIPLFALATILLSISWALALTSLILTTGLGYPLFFFVPTVMIILILGLGTDYNIFLLTRIREERLRKQGNSEAIVQAVGHTGGIITAAAIILASAFAILGVGNFTLLRTIGFGVAIAVLLDALVVRTYLVPATLRKMGDRVWDLRLRHPPVSGHSDSASAPADQE